MYAWTTTNGGGFSPVTPPDNAIAVLAKRGYLPYAAPSEPQRRGALEVTVNTSNISSIAVQALGEMGGGKGRHPHYMVGSPTNVEV